MGDDIDPLESFEFVDGHIDSKEGVVKKKIGNINYGFCRVAATVRENFDLSRYPLDKQKLKIRVEDTKFTAAEMSYCPGKANTAISPEIDIPGWRIAKSDSHESVTTYSTNYGDISLPSNAGSKYPRFTFSLELTRGGYAIFIKLFSMLFLAGGLTFCAFGLKSDHIGERFSLILAGVFLAAITQNTLTTVLPESDSFSMGDQLYNMTMVFIFLIFLACIYTYKIFHDGDEPRADKIFSLIGRWMFAGYMAANLLVVFLSGQVFSRQSRCSFDGAEETPELRIALPNNW